MKNICFVILIVISFFFAISEVNAIEAGSATNRTLVYKINSIVIDEDYTTLKGYAYIDKHNNHHFSYMNDGEKGITLMKIVAYNGATYINPTSLTFYDGNVPGYTYNPNGICWKAACTKNANGSWSFTNPDQPYIEPNSISDCLNKHVFFEAKFKTRNLRNEKNIKFKIEISYDLEHERRPCSEHDNGQTTNGYISNNINNNVSLASYWGGSATKDAEIKSVSTCKVGSYNCENNQGLNYGIVKTKINVTNNGNEFKLSFSTEGNISGSIMNKNKNVDLNLVCENANFYSGTLEKVSTTYEYTAGTGRCEHTEYVTISADYVAIESAVLKFDLDRGPIYAGGAFGFKVDYTNVAKWYYVDNVPECPLITVSGITPDSYESCHTNEDGSESCRTVEICVDSESGYDPRCNEPDESRLRFEEKIASERYTALNNGGSSSPNVKLKMDNNNNSNSVNNPNIVSDIGEWVCENDPSMDSRWEPNTEWVTKCTYRLKESKLNRMTADVKYTNNACASSEICKSDIYYVPLKWMNDKFNVFIDFGRVNTRSLSTINGINWHVDYTCDVDVVQMLYNKNGKGYQFFYRPIDLNNPFPNRDPSTNWISWWNDNINKEQLALGYNNKEYSVALTPEDMRRLKEYNEDKVNNSGNNLGYLDYSIRDNGKSNFVDRYMNRYTTDYNKLGEVR